jgi:hypothetical protein
MYRYRLQINWEIKKKVICERLCLLSNQNYKTITKKCKEIANKQIHTDTYEGQKKTCIIYTGLP